MNNVNDRLVEAYLRMILESSNDDKDDFNIKKESIKVYQTGDIGISIFGKDLSNSVKNDNNLAKATTMRGLIDYIIKSVINSHTEEIKKAL